MARSAIAGFGDAVDDAADVAALGGRRQHRVFGPGGQVLPQPFGLGEEAGALKDDFDAQGLPGQVDRVPLAQILNGLPGHLQGPVGDFHPMFVPAVGGVVVEQIGQIINGHQIVDCNQVQFRLIHNNF